MTDDEMEISDEFIRGAYYNRIRNLAIELIDAYQEHEGIDSLGLRETAEAPMCTLNIVINEDGSRDVSFNFVMEPKALSASEAV